MSSRVHGVYVKNFIGEVAFELGHGVVLEIK